MPAPALREVQGAFWRALHTGDVAPALARVVVPTATLDAGGRVGIYQSMYGWRLSEVLREDYPRLAEALGADFQDLARRYLAAHPSENPSVRHFGRHLADFLRDDSRPWLADLARLERARGDAFDAPDAVPLGSADLADVAPEAWAAMGFDAVSSLAIVDAAWAVDEVWAAPAQVPAQAPTRLRVWRQGFSVFHAVMDAVETDALRAVIANAPFADVCEGVARHVPPEDAPAEAGSLLVRWLEDGLIARLR